MYDRNLVQGPSPLGLPAGRLGRVGVERHMEEEEGKVLVLAPLSPLALLGQPKRRDVPLGCLVVDAAW